MGCEMRLCLTQVLAYKISSMHFMYKVTIYIQVKDPCYIIRSAIILRKGFTRSSRPLGQQISQTVHADSKPAGLGEQQSHVHIAGVNLLDGFPFFWVILLIHSFFKLTLDCICKCIQDSNSVLFLSISFLQNFPYSQVCHPPYASVSLSNWL